MLKKDAVVIHSGGMDSSICLALAIKEFGRENVLSLSFTYGQRHNRELEQAAKISREWNVDHTIVNMDSLRAITDNALINSSIKIEQKRNQPPNTLIVGRNGVMAHLGGIHANHLGAKCIYMGVIEVEAWNSGYRDCSRAYMDLMQEILRIDLDDPFFEIRTPVVMMSKSETLEVAKELGILEYLLKETITCYEGISLQGCLTCPACILRNEGIRIFRKNHPNFSLPYCL